MDIGKAISESIRAKTAPPHSFKIGDIVIANNDCFTDLECEIVALETNMAGAPLIGVKYKKGSYSGKTAFYAHELTKKGER